MVSKAERSRINKNTMPDLDTQTESSKLKISRLDQTDDEKPHWKRDKTLLSELKHFSNDVTIINAMSLV